MTHLLLGQKAPDFNLPDQNGKMHSLNDYAGQWLLIFFYPKDMTPGCTIEAQEMRNVYEKFKDYDCAVLGVSKDTQKQHQKFIEKESLPFDLLSDTEQKMLKAYDVLHEKSMFGKKYMGVMRTSFLINPDGNIERIYDEVKPSEHAEEVLADLRYLQSEHVSA